MGFEGLALVEEKISKREKNGSMSEKMRSKKYQR